MDDLNNMIDIIVEDYNKTFCEMNIEYLKCKHTAQSTLIDFLDAAANATNKHLLQYAGDDPQMLDLLHHKNNFNCNIYYNIYYDNLMVKDVPTFYLNSYINSMASVGLDFDNLSLDDPVLAPIGITLDFVFGSPVYETITIIPSLDDHNHGLINFKPVITFAVMLFSFNFKKINNFIIETMRACVKSTKKLVDYYHINTDIVSKIHNNFIKQNIEVPDGLVLEAYNKNFIDPKLLKKIKLKYLYNYDIDSKNNNGDPDDDFADLRRMNEELFGVPNNKSTNDEDAGPLDSDWGDDDDDQTN